MKVYGALTRPVLPCWHSGWTLDWCDHCAGLGQKSFSSTVEGIEAGILLFFHLRLRWESISTALDDLLGKLGGGGGGFPMGSGVLLPLLSPFLRFVRFILRLIMGSAV